MEPAAFAEHVLRAVAANRAFAVDPEFWKSVGWLNRPTQYLGMFSATRAFELRIRSPPPGPVRSTGPHDGLTSSDRRRRAGP